MGNQKEIVYNLVKQAGSLGIRTEQIKIQSMLKGVSCPDRYCRYYQEAGEMRSKYVEEKDKTKTWWIIKETFRVGLAEPVEKIKPFSFPDFTVGTKRTILKNTGDLRKELARQPEPQLTMSFINAHKPDFLT